jgi:hypothetical protein
MRIAKLILATSLVLLAAAFVVAKEKESYDGTPFQQWAQSAVSKMLSNSPWAQQWGTGEAFQTMGQDSSQTVQGQTEAQNTFTVRLFSSLAIRQAFVRATEITNGYDSMPPDGKKDFDSKVNGLLSADVSQEVVLAVTFKSNMPETTRDIQRFFGTATAATLNQSAYLYGPRGRIDLLKYFPPSNEVSFARFIFPRMVNGQPLLQPGDKQLRFEVYIPPIDQVLKVGFDPRKMMFQGKLDY